MKKIFTFLMLLNMIILSNLHAQNGDLLYGVTSTGGSEDQGVIFHIDPTTGLQTVDYSLPVMNKGKTPDGDLTMGANGKFYGMTSLGGNNNKGVIFEWDPADNKYTNKIDFDGVAKGSYPHGSLSLRDGKFYGLAGGGVNGFGVIFEWDPSDNSFVKMIDFDGPDKGANPYGTLTLCGGKFYGMTRFGGTNNKGVMFEWDPSNNNFAKKVDFEGSASGSMPTNGYLTIFDGKLYGMTSSGGSGYGVIFEWDPANNIFTKKINFDGIQGASPQGSLTLSNGKLYGMTYQGGIYGAGVIFEWDPVANILTKKMDFDVTVPDGYSPIGSLSLSNGKFYGTTRDGGKNFYGVIFEWDPNTNIYIKKKDFEGHSNGSHPSGSLAYGNGKFYGMTTDYEQGYQIGNGVIFEWDPNNNAFIRKIMLNSSGEGSNPYGSLILKDGKFYGMTSKGGENGEGVIFEWDPSNSTYSKKIDFDAALMGSKPSGSLVLYNGKLYGMTSSGGTNNSGVIFEWDPVSNTYTKKVEFDNITMGSSPVGSMIIEREIFYGMTSAGGANGEGVIFKWDPETNIYTKKIDFDGTEKGSSPFGDLALYEGKFCGMTCYGGTAGSGVLFEWNPVNNLFTKKRDFDSNASGLYPKGSLSLKEGKFYGMTTNGGENGAGIIFEWDPASNDFVKKVDFETAATGWNPQGSLILANGKFYGMTNNGGGSYKGVIFEWDPDNNSIVKLQDFNGNNGSSPVYTSFAIYNVMILSSDWTGLVDNNWFNAGNWNQGIPESYTNVTIPSDVANYPTLETPASCASITIESGASFIGAEYLTVVTATVKHDIADSQYHYLSSPVGAASFADVFSGSLTTWAKRWDPLTGSWVWQTSLNSFLPGAGYAVTTSTPAITGNFVGSLNKTDVTSTLSNAFGGWNLLGNPFQSAVNWDDFIKDAGVSASVAFWTGSNYLYWNGTVGFGGIIPAETGFFTSTTIDGSTITIPLTSRLHSVVPFYKEDVSNALELRANGNNESDQMFVHFNDDATAAYDNQFDARKLFGEAFAPQLYSIISNEVLAINELPMAGNEVVDLGFSCNTDGNYSITTAGIESFDESTPILLEDMQAGITQDLRLNPVYSFSYAAGEDAHRFRLHFVSTTDIRAISNSGLSVFFNDHNLVIGNATSQAGDVFVYDMAGRQLIHTKLSGNLTTSIPMNASTGTYMVKVVTAKSGFNKKVFIR